MPSVFDLTDVIDSLGTGEVVVERAVRPIGFVNGNAVVDTPDPITIDANVQPASPRDLMRLPENDRTREIVIVFTKEALEVSSPTTGKMGDVVRYADRRFEVIRREDWLVQSGHFRCWAAKIEGDR